MNPAMSGIATCSLLTEMKRIILGRPALNRSASFRLLQMKSPATRKAPVPSASFDNSAVRKSSTYPVSWNQSSSV